LTDAADAPADDGRPTACCDHPRLTDAAYEEQCERIRSLVVGLLPTMGLGNYEARLTLVPGQLDDPDNIMSITSDWRYEFLTIHASVERCAEESDEELTYDVLHEGAHAHLALVRPNDVTDDHRDREELAATRLGRMALAFGKRCADQVRAELEAELVELRRRCIREVETEEAA
jgi:hypothetical protein